MAKELEFVSQITKNTCEDFQLFGFITNLQNFEQLLPPEAKEKITLSEDSITIHAMGSMSVTLSILEKEPYKTLKIGTQGNEMFRIWIQLKQVAPYDTRIRVTLKANIPLIARPMIKKDQLQQLVDSIALALGSLPIQLLQGYTDKNE